MSEVTINTVCSIRNSLMYRGGKIWMFKSKKLAVKLDRCKVKVQ